jgi:hypothetical protein
MTSSIQQKQEQARAKTLPKNEKTKTTPRMNSAIQVEDRASSSRSKHEGESSFSLCDRLSRTRDLSQRQLPTDHDYAVSTREYQTDQSSLKTAFDCCLPCPRRTEKQPQRQKQPHRFSAVDGVTPYQGCSAAGSGCGMGTFASSRRWTPFRPDQKVKLDKGEATRGGSSCVMAFWAMTRAGTPLPLLTGQVTFSRRWRWKSVRALTGWL